MASIKIAAGRTRYFILQLDRETQEVVDKLHRNDETAALEYARQAQDDGYDVQVIRGEVIYGVEVE